MFSRVTWRDRRNSEGAIIRHINIIKRAHIGGTAWIHRGTNRSAKKGGRRTYSEIGGKNARGVRDGGWG